MVMVTRANKHYDGIGGHISTYASSASLYEVGFNHFFRGKDDGTPAIRFSFRDMPRPEFMPEHFSRDGLPNRKWIISAGNRFRAGAFFLSASAADAAFLGISHGLDGIRAADRDLSGSLQSLSAGARTSRIRKTRVSGVSLATESVMSRKRWALFSWLRAKSSTISFLW